MKPVYLLVLLLPFYILSGCNPISEKNISDNRYENLEKFTQFMMSNQDSLGKIYHIKEFGFDGECIYGKEDLTNLVVRLVSELGGYKIDKVSGAIDNDLKEFVTTVIISGKTFEFRTSSEGDYVDTDKLLASLDSLTNQLSPEYKFNLCNPPYDQSAIIAYSTKKDIKDAVDNGYPCSLDDERWYWRNDEWKWGVYSDITLKSIPDYDVLKIKYQETLKELCKKGYNVPLLTIHRIYITDMFKSSDVDICIDGAMNTSSNKIMGNKVRCFWEGYGVVLAYTLIKHFEGVPELYDKEQKKTYSITREEYFLKAEQAFGNRK